MGFTKFLKTFKLPTRYLIALMLFLATMINYMLRLNFSVNIVAMVKSTNKEAEDLPNYGPRYFWSESQQALLLGAYFFGYLWLSIPSEMLAEQFGGTFVVGVPLFISAILNGLIPLLAKSGFITVFFIRFFIGFLGGVTYPACYNLISQWAPQNEKEVFIGCLMGGIFGTIISMPVSGLLIVYFGWNWSFYVGTIFALIICGLWFHLVADKPSLHKTISPEERMYIEDLLENNSAGKRKWPPFLSWLTSLPFIALIFLHYGNIWGLHFVIIMIPKFLYEILEFDIFNTGFLSILPNLVRICFALIFGMIEGVIISRNYLSTTAIRKSFCLFSHILPGSLLILLVLTVKNPYYYLGVITLSLGFNGAATLTNLQNSQDLSPKYADKLYGIISFVASTSGFTLPLVVAAFTREENSLAQWKYVFLVGAIFYIIPALFFIVFGSGKEQKWNFEEKVDKPNENDAKNSAKN